MSRRDTQSEIKIGRKSNQILEVTDINVYKKLINDEPCLIKFTAEWCGPCRKIAPLFKDKAAKHWEIINFVEVDIDKADAIATKEGVQSIPYFIFYKDGVKCDDLELRGANPQKFELNVSKFVEEVETAIRVLAEIEDSDDSESEDETILNTMNKNSEETVSKSQEVDVKSVSKEEDNNDSKSNHPENSSTSEDNLEEYGIDCDNDS